MKQGKSIRATETGINLIHTIISPLLKSAELTGLWEKKLREIERGEYQAQDFLAELKEMTSGVVRDVKTNKAGMLCPVCRQGLICKSYFFISDNDFIFSCKNCNYRRGKYTWDFELRGDEGF